MRLLALMIVLGLTSALHGQPKKDVNYDEARVGSLPLPDPLQGADGTRVETAQQWIGQRRPEVLRLFEREMYGSVPEAARKPALRFVTLAEDREALGGSATRREVAIHLAGRERPLAEILLYLPNKDRRPAGVFVGLNFGGNHSVTADPAVRLATGWFADKPETGYSNHRATERSRGSSARRWPIEQIVASGYGVATAYYGDFEPDHKNGFADGLRKGFVPAGRSAPEPHEWGAIAAWAWGLSRIADYLVTIPEEVNPNQLAVLGHSRLGKTSLWAGAADARFGLVISNNSGAGGAALSKRHFGESVAALNRSFPHWFCGNFKAYSDNEAALPMDQHELIALIAPRPVYVASATEDLWADPKGEFLAAKRAEPVYALFGKAGLGIDEPPPADQRAGDMIGYHARRGKHDILLFDWQQYLRFADRHWGKPE